MIWMQDQQIYSTAYDSVLLEFTCKLLPHKCDVLIKFTRTKLPTHTTNQETMYICHMAQIKSCVISCFVSDV